MIKNIFIFLFAMLCVSEASFSQSKKEVTTQLSGNKNNPQGAVVDSLKTPSPTAKHQLQGSKNATSSSNIDVELVTTPAGATKVTGKRNQ